MTTATVDAEVMGEETATRALVVQPERSSVLLMPVMNVQTAMARLKEFQEFVKGYLVESKDGGADGGDFGTIPGTQKPTLLKSGADKLCEVYGLADEYEIVSKIEDWSIGLFDYTIKCRLLSRRDDSLVGTGVGSCSSWESKYRWRMGERVCPECGKATIIKGKADFGGGWLCWSKKGGCGEKFDDADPQITGQNVGRVENPDIIDTKNTVLKMAKKRAKIDAVIGVTRSAGIFTQDMEEAAIKDELTVDTVRAPQAVSQAAPAVASAPQPQAARPSSNNGNGASGDQRLISPAQDKRLWAIANECQVNRAAVLAHIAPMGYADTPDIKRANYNAIVGWIQSQ